MAATYVQITREEMHEWLDNASRSISEIQRWTKVQGKEGVYNLPLSKAVAVQISTSIGQRDTAMAVGQAAIHTKLVSLVTGRVLNKKAAEQSRVNRTTNWAKNLITVVKKLVAAYQKSPKFYEVIAQEGGIEKYVEKWKKDVEGILNWQSNRQLRDIHAQLVSGRILSDADENFVTRFEDERIPADTAKNEDEGDWGTRIRSINGWERSKFLRSMMERIESGRSLSAPMMDAIERIESTWDKGPPASTRPAQDLEYVRTWTGRIQDIPGWKTHAFLQDLLQKVERGFQLTPAQVTAVGKVEQFNRALRESWLQRLRSLYAKAREGGNEAVVSTLADIGKRLKADISAAHPLKEDMDVMLGMLPRGSVQDLVIKSTPKPPRTASMAEHVAILYMGIA